MAHHRSQFSSANFREIRKTLANNEIEESLGNVDEFEDGIRLGRGAMAHLEQFNSIRQFTIQERGFLSDLDSAMPPWPFFIVRVQIPKRIRLLQFQDGITPITVHHLHYFMLWLH